jgi:LmbE family N-acetylglucosaminyl deacetylase/ActR/RegA family two-component response regulator
MQNGQGTMGELPSILLVEDDEVFANLAIEVLRPLARVTWVATGEEAISLAPSENWDLVITDIELPGIDGIEFLKTVRSAHPLLATLVLSGHQSFEYAIAAIRASADDYMTKPVKPEELAAKVAELIELSRGRHVHRSEVALAIGAHPDDVEIGCAGLLLRHASAGDEVAVLTLTGGEAGGEVVDRARESERAAELMSARLIHTDLQDTSVSDAGVTIQTIKRAIDETGATTIYTHTPRDVHQDHRNTHNATLVAAREVPRVYCYQSPSTTVEFQPTRFASIDEFMDRKLEVIRAYASQVSVRRYLDEELLRATARYWARFAGSRYVEPLEVLRESDGDGPVHVGDPAAIGEEAG